MITSGSQTLEKDEIDIDCDRNHEIRVIDSALTTNVVHLFFDIKSTLRIPPLYRFRLKTSQNGSDTLIGYIESIFGHFRYP